MGIYIRGELGRDGMWGRWKSAELWGNFKILR